MFILVDAVPKTPRSNKLNLCNNNKDWYLKLTNFVVINKLVYIVLILTLCMYIYIYISSAMSQNLPADINILYIF